MWRDFINSIRRKRAKKQLNKALKVISKLSWEELDNMFPKPSYKLAFKKSDWSNVRFAYPPNLTEKGGEQ